MQCSQKYIAAKQISLLLFFILRSGVCNRPSFRAFPSERRVYFKQSGNKGCNERTNHNKDKKASVPHLLLNPASHHARQHHAKSHQSGAESIDRRTALTTREVYQIKHISGKTEAVAELLNKDTSVYHKHACILNVTEIDINRIGKGNAQHHRP